MFRHSLVCASGGSQKARQLGFLFLSPSQLVVSESGQGKTYKTKRNRVDVGLKKRGECDILVPLFSPPH